MRCDFVEALVGLGSERYDEAELCVLGVRKCGRASVCGEAWECLTFMNTTADTMEMLR